jgi:acetyl-CoA synthetase
LTSYRWTPNAAYIDGARVTRFARRHGLASIDDLRARSVADIEWYWDAAIDDLAIPFRRRYSQVLDERAGIEHPEWFVGSSINLVDACIGRWVADSVTADQAAVIHEDEAGAVRTLTYRELDEQVRRASSGLRRLGVGKGDAVALYLPMTIEAVVSFYAIARVGALAVPLFSGFGAPAIAARLQDAQAKVVISTESTVRRGRSVAMRAVLDEAVAGCPSVEHVVVIGTPGWAELVATDDGRDAEPMDPGDPLMLGYTSGTTGRPKGAVHTHPGFLVKTASEVAYGFDINVGGVFFWVTDLGWVMGPLSIVGTHANGATILLYEGSPDVPDVNRLWQLVQKHRVTMLGVSPSLIRSQRAGRDALRDDIDLSSVHVIGSTGEPWDPQSYEWLALERFGGRVPIINFSGGTEVGGSFLTPYPVEPIASCSVGGPSLGMAVDVVDADGRSVRGQVGELVCRRPWPSMTRGVWRDPERYLDSYWRAFPGMWHHGDFALVEQHDGHDEWFILGRSDDVMNVAGKRLAPAEVESIVARHPAVAEAAAVGVPDPVKGEALWVLWVPRAGADRASDDVVAAEVTAMVAAELGKPFAPSAVVAAPTLPRTRSAKLLRRVIRAAIIGEDPGDLSGAENPEAIDQLRDLVNQRQPK